jgi:NhaP-type Na+/H+ or K+/H+ antiporter
LARINVTLRSLAEVTLALLFFSDAALINTHVLHNDRGIPLRLLLVGLPFTIAIGTALAIVLFSGLDPWGAAIIAAGSRPPTPRSEHRSTKIGSAGAHRRALNVESGLTDGIATPFVTFFIAGAVADAATRSVSC